MCTMITEPSETCESIVLAIHSGSCTAQSSQYVSPSAWRALRHARDMAGESSPCGANHRLG